MKRGEEAVQVELLVSPGCSSREEAEKAIVQILSELAPQTAFRTIVVDSSEKAATLKFPGSPTVRVNGRDIEPDADRSLNYGLS
jgi:hypothetical protein